MLLVSFGPHTVLGKDGKAVVRERLAIVEAEAAAEVPEPRTSWVPTPRRVPRLDAVPPQAMPAPALRPSLPAPVVPSRSIPQGIHADGTPADLPPLPPDEAEEPDSQSAEPMASPQTKKTPKPRPHADPGAGKAEYTPPRPIPLPSLFMPAPAIGLQFLLPLKPLSFKLPFNRKLDIEIYGRVVPDPQPPAGSN
jgi:hypothetical protein